MTNAKFGFELLKMGIDYHQRLRPCKDSGFECAGYVEESDVADICEMRERGVKIL